MMMMMMMIDWGRGGCKDRGGGTGDLKRNGKGRVAD